MLTRSRAVARLRRGAPIGPRRRSCCPDFTSRRKELNLTCTAIAALLSRAGKRTSFQAVSRWEKAGTCPSESRIPLLAKILQISEPACYAMFRLDFGGEDRAREHQAHRRPVSQGAN